MSKGTEILRSPNTRTASVSTGRFTKPSQTPKKPTHSPGFAVPNTSPLADKPPAKAAEQKDVQRDGVSLRQGRRTRQGCSVQRNSISPASRPTVTCPEAPQRLQANDTIQKAEGDRKKRKKKNLLTSTTGTTSALIRHPKVGSLKLNLHFKSDFKNTLLCFP